MIGLSWLFKVVYSICFLHGSTTWKRNSPLLPLLKTHCYSFQAPENWESVTMDAPKQPLRKSWGRLPSDQFMSSSVYDQKALQKVKLKPIPFPPTLQGIPLHKPYSENSPSNGSACLPATAAALARRGVMRCVATSGMLPILYVPLCWAVVQKMPARPQHTKQKAFPICRRERGPFHFSYHV